MKIKFITLAAGLMAFVACNNSSSNEHDHHHDDSDTSMHHHDEDTAATTQKNETTIFSGTETITAYLELKNALAADNTTNAAEAGKKLNASLLAIDKNGLTEVQLKAFTDISADALEHSQHIAVNGGNIKHQREHFEILSKDLADFIKAFGTSGKVLYKDFCPMAGDGKGAIWISELKEIKNPYLGSEMPTCGIVKEEMK